jgi:hypothetical protein
MHTRTIRIGGGLAAAALLAAGCSSSARPGAGDSTQLRVSLALYGGPLTPDGHMAVSGAPASGELVHVRSDSGRTWTASTGFDGVAVFHLPAGHYRVWSQCGASRSVTVAFGSTASTSFSCDVP